MVRLKLSPETLTFSTLMEKRSRTKVKDCFVGPNGTIYFVVAHWDMGKILGKNGATIKEIQKEFGKKVKIIPFNDNLVTFIKNIIFPLIVEEILEEEKIVFIKDSNKKTKSLLIGRAGQNLQLINRAIQRFFPNKEVKVMSK